MRCIILVLALCCTLFALPNAVQAQDRHELVLQALKKLDGDLRRVERQVRANGTRLDALERQRRNASRNVYSNGGVTLYYTPGSNVYYVPTYDVYQNVMWYYVE